LHTHKSCTNSVSWTIKGGIAKAEFRSVFYHA
jgi:hypothetical protein